MSKQDIVLTKKNLAELKKLHKKAIEEGRKTFSFEGKELVTGYAKYLIEYGESMLGD